jgi:DNA-binding response OmpR family regulator
MKGELKQQERANGCGAIARNPGILIADDMALILTLLKFELESRGFAVWLAVDGDDALDLYRRHRNEIDLVLLDVQMTGLDGPHTLTALQKLCPTVRCCFMTGNLTPYTEEGLLQMGAMRVFRKPFAFTEVIDTLRAVLRLKEQYSRCPRLTGRCS